MYIGCSQTFTFESHIFHCVLLFVFIKIASLNFFFFVCEDNPIILVVIFVSTSAEQVLEHGSHRGVVGSLIEPQIPGLAEILGELNGVILAKNFDGGGKLLLLDPLILVLLVIGLKPLPWKHSPEEVHCNVSDTFHIISASYG